MFQLRRVVTAAALACAVPLASASVLTFEEFGPGLAFFTANYNGFKFGTNSVTDNAFFHTSQVSPFYTPTSGSVYMAVDFTLYNNFDSYQGTTAASLSGPQQLITNTTPFLFNGAFFTGSDTIGYKLYSGNSVVFTSAPSAALSNMPIFVASSYTGLVTGVEIFGRQGFYALDDFTYNVTPPVPEPGTYALMLAGLAAVGGVAARRRRSA